MNTKPQMLLTSIEVTYDKLELYRYLDQQIKALTRESEDIKKELKDNYFKDNDDFVYEGRLIATCTTQIAERIDTKSLKEKRPDIYNLFQVETLSRVLRMK